MWNILSLKKSIRKQYLNPTFLPFLVPIAYEMEEIDSFEN